MELGIDGVIPDGRSIFGWAFAFNEQDLAFIPFSRSQRIWSYRPDLDDGNVGDIVVDRQWPFEGPPVAFSTRKPLCHYLLPDELDCLKTIGLHQLQGVDEANMALQ